MDEWTWEEQQDTLDYRQWKAEQDAQRELDAAIAQWEAEYEAQLDSNWWHAHAPEPEPLPPDPPDDWDEDGEDNPHYDTPMGL